MRRSARIAVLAATVLALTAAHAYATTLYYGGPIMPMSQTAMVVWTTTNQASDYLSTVQNYFTDAAAASGSTSDFYAIFSEYRTVGLTAQDGLPGSNQYLDNRQRFLGRFDITPSNTGTTLYMSDVSAEINAQIAAGHLPAPTAGPSTAYFVLFPGTGYTLYDNPSNNGQAGVVWCDIHGDGVYNGVKYTFAEIPDWSAGTPGSGGCGNNASYINNQTANISHQHAEMITDPLVADATGNTTDRPIAWYDTSTGEIGDACNAQQATTTMNGHTYTVQKEWSAVATACIASTSNFAAPTGSFTATPSPQHIAVDASSSLSPNTDHGFHEYDWDFGDGTTGTGVTAAHDYAVGGTYHVTLTAWDDAGFSGVSSQDVSVPAIPPPAPTSGGGSTPPTTSTQPTASPAPVVARCVVPKLKGKTLAQARKALAKAHCKLGKIGRRGKPAKKLVIVAQKPKPGTRLRAGAKVAVTLAAAKTR